MDWLVSWGPRYYSLYLDFNTRRRARKVIGTLKKSALSSGSSQRTTLLDNNTINWRDTTHFWRWLPDRLSKRQSLSTTKVLFRTFFTRTIKLNLLLKWLLGSNLSQKTKQLPGPVFTGISEKKPLQDQGSGGDSSDHYWCIKGISESLPRVESLVPSVDTSWSEWSRITDPDPDLPKRTRSKVSSYICTASVAKASVHTEQDWKRNLILHSSLQIIHLKRIFLQTFVKE